MAQLQLGTHQIRDFGVIREIDEGRLKEVVKKTSGISPLPLKPATLLSVVTKAFEGDKAKAEAVVRQCLSLNGLMRQTGIDADSVIEGVRLGLAADSNWSIEERSKWETLEPTFRDLLAIDAFRIVAKSIELSYDYANLYRRGRILTDIRPLYTNDATEIVGAVVSYTLRLRYDNDEGDRDLSLAMDESDIRQLQEQCNRALNKAKTARALMEDKAKVQTIITGEKDNG
jgi:hypothetical protein